ncbi:cupin domain-containing protein [Ottowia sp. VDI28]|uniref:cupin domain-containing protein n=1 Tax=Ottowia sp. VDI28 TaxID=3133968 RepID=UPI003C2C6B97
MENKQNMYRNGQVRRVVTGHDAQGRAVVSSDGMAPNVIAHPHRPGYFSTQLWTTFATPAPIGNEADPTAEAGKMPLAPPAGGSVVRVVDFPPESDAVKTLDSEQAKAAFDAIGGHGASTFQAGARHPFMHRTESIDYGIVLSGEIYLVLDEREVLVKAGDVVVQRGTNHAWSNRSGAHCQVLFVLIDGKFGPDCLGA